MPGGLTPLDDETTMDEWLQQRNQQLAGDPSFGDAGPGDAMIGAPDPRQPMPLSTPDPDAGPWAAMVAQNQALQARNDPLQPMSGAQVYPLDQFDAARRQAQGPGGGSPYDQFAPEAVDKTVRDFLPPAIAPSPPSAPPASSSKRDAARDFGAGWVMDELAKAEGTAGDAGYDATFGGPAARPPGSKKPTELSLDEWSALQAANRKRNGSSATGKFQFMPETLADVRKAMGLTGSEIATQDLQDRMGREVLRMAGYDDFLNGKIDAEAFRHRLAGRFASLPDPQKGDLSHYGQRLGTTPQSLKAAIAAAKAEADHLADVGRYPDNFPWR